MRVFAGDLFQTITSEHLALGTGGVKNTVAEEQEDVTAMRAQAHLVVGRIVEQSDGKAGRLDFFQLAIVKI